LYGGSVAYKLSEQLTEQSVEIPIIIWRALAHSQYVYAGSSLASWRARGVTKTW